MGVIISKKPKVLVTILHQGWVRPELAAKLAAIKVDSRADVEIVFTSLQPSENNRNNNVKLALDGGYDYLISIDHDNPPLRNPIDLVLLDRDVVGFAVPQWNTSDPRERYPVYFVGMDKVKNGYKEHKNKKGLQEVDAVGSGCLVVSRRVLEAVKDPFVRKWKNGIAITGLDFYFCEKAKKKGFKIYCHYDYICDHFKELSLLEVLKFKNS